MSKPPPAPVEPPKLDATGRPIPTTFEGWYAKVCGDVLALGLTPPDPTEGMREWVKEAARRDEEAARIAALPDPE